MATCFGGVGNTSMENPVTGDVDDSEDDFQDKNIVKKLLCKTDHLKLNCRGQGQWP